MNRFSVIFVQIISVAAMLGSIATAQAPSLGTPPFSSLGGGPFDTVNLGNLNVHFAVPIIHKAGRSLPFNYDLIYESTIYQIVTVAGKPNWQPIHTVNNVVSYWGFQGLGPVVTPYVGYSMIQSTPTCFPFPDSTPVSYTLVTYSSFAFHDPSGTTHPFNITFLVTSGAPSNGPGGNCPANGSQPPTAQTASSYDSSGYVLTVGVPSGGNASGSLVFRNGTAIGAPFLSQPPTTSSPYAVTDVNGNKISFNNGVYTDTLGTAVLTVSGTEPSPTTLTYTTPVGSKAYTVNYTAFNIQTKFGCSVGEYSANNVPLVTSIVLPDTSQQYSFSYELTPGSTTTYTGRLSTITLPSGGTITYNYTGANDGVNCSDGTTLGLQRVLSPGGSWQYTRTGSGSAWTTNVTDPSNNQTALTFAEFLSNFYETERQVYQGSNSGTPCSTTVTNNCWLSTNITCYNANYTNCSTAGVSAQITEKDAYTQLPNGSIRLSQLLFNLFGLVTDDREYDFGVSLGSAPTSTSRVRETVTTYATNLGTQINDRPHTVVVSDWSTGTAVTLFSSTYSYDGSTPTPTSNTPQHVSVSGPRGNLTTITTSTQGTASLSQSFSYYDTGNPNTSTDAANHSTTYVYSSSPNPFSSSFTASCGNSFPTTLQKPLGLMISMEWNCSGGVAAQVQDENQKIVTSNYADANFWRPTTVTDQMSNAINFSYFGSTGVEAALQNFNSGNSVSDGRNTVDGFGRTILAQRLQGPGGAYDTVETDYNNIGLPIRSTLAFSAPAGGTNATAPATTMTYDALGRVLTVQDAGRGQVTYQYINNDILQTASGTGTRSFEKQLEYDGLGRLRSVCEMTQLTGSGTCGQTNSVNGYWTKYTYDALGHILTVTQNAQAATANQQTRSFVYDMLGRLISETNPESGTTAYVYDTEPSCGGNGSSTSNGDLLQRTDANGNQLCFYYDSLHRLTDVGNSNQALSHCRRFRYDNSAGYAGSTKPAGLVNTLGRLIEAATDDCSTDDALITDEWFSYDARGELTDVYESTPHSGGYYHTSAAYWPNGALHTIGGIPGTPTISYGANGSGLDGQGRVTQVTASTGINPVTAVTYSTTANPNVLGALTAVTFGSGDGDAFTYDSNTGRILSYSFNVNAKSDAGTLTWNSNGTLGKLIVNDQIPGTADNQTCTFGYDDLQRISTTNCGTFWTQNFTYDPMGNIRKQVPSGDSGLSFLPTYSTTPPTNRFTAIPGVSVNYDASGNLLTDNLNTYTWDLYGRMLTVNSLSSSVNVIYDALGRMVENSQSGTFTEFVYGPAGAKLATCNGQTLIKALINLPGGAKAIYNSSGLAYYRHSDWLGSSRLTSTQSRAMYSSSAYAPFGEQFGTSGTSDPSFTGQDQDTVSTLYDFPSRRYSPSQGRWISPDPLGSRAATLSNPQSWNRYVYVKNDPLRLIDLVGLRPRQHDQSDPNQGAGDDDDNGGGDDSAGGGDSGVGGDDDLGTGDDGSSVSGDDSGCTFDENNTLTCPGPPPAETQNSQLPSLCIAIFGGVNNGPSDTAFQDAVDEANAFAFFPLQGSGKAAGTANAIKSGLGGSNVKQMANWINGLYANGNTNLVLYLFSGSGGTFQGVWDAAPGTPGSLTPGARAAISEAIFISPGGLSYPDFGSLPTQTFIGKGALDDTVQASNFLLPNPTGVALNAYPGKVTQINAPHSFALEWNTPAVQQTIPLGSDCIQSNTVGSNRKPSKLQTHQVTHEVARLDSPRANDGMDGNNSLRRPDDSDHAIRCESTVGPYSTTQQQQ